MFYVWTVVLDKGLLIALWELKCICEVPELRLEFTVNVRFRYRTRMFLYVMGVFLSCQFTSY